MKTKNKRRADDMDDEEFADEAEMEVDKDEDDEILGNDKDTAEESDSDDDEPNDDDDAPALSIRERDGNNTFFDTFYGLSSVDSRERSQAAKEMLDHCLVGPSANAKDALYAFKRLLNGICSGRAAARQGNASALAIFLKQAFMQGMIKDIQASSSSDDEKGMSLLTYVRHRLLESTEPGIGKRKGSEDRDYKFGRLFGILGVVRSGILLPSDESSSDLPEFLETVTGFVDDLAELYLYKKWMREPAAHAIGTLLSSFYAISSEKPEVQSIVDQLVQNVIAPKLLSVGDLADNGPTSKSSSFSAEQVAMAIHIQAHANIHSARVINSLGLPVMTPETIQSMAVALAETSSVTHPRIHLFWDAFMSYVTEPIDTSTIIQERKLRTVCPVGDVSPVDLIQAILRHVVIENLLGVREGQTQTRTTHERSALGLCIIRNLAGVEYVSSITGLTRLVLDAETIEHVVLQSQIVKHLFLNVLGAGSAGRKKQSAHILRPLAIQVLDSIADSAGDGDDAIPRRLSIVRALLRCDARFDSKAKTGLLDKLLMMNGNQVAVQPSLWDQHLDYLQSQLMKASSDESNSTISLYDAQGYVDLIFHHGRTLFHSTATEEQLGYKSSSGRSLLVYLLTVSFFDCENIKSPPTSSKKNKGKKATKQDPVVEAACGIKARRSGLGVLAYNLRSTLSSRFYSLVAEAIADELHSPDKDKENAAFELLSYLSTACHDLEVAGATRLDTDAETVGLAQEVDPHTLLDSLYEDTRRARESASDGKRQRFATACSILATTLYLHMLDCGSSDSLDDEDINADPENDANESVEYLSGLQEVCRLFLKHAVEGEDDPMVSMSDLCAAILSSPIATGSESKGGFPRLLREAVKLVWVSSLSLRAALDGKTPLGAGVYAILLRSIGVDDNDAMDVDEDDENNESESDDDTVGDSDDSGAVFSRAVDSSDLLVEDQSDIRSEAKHESDDEESEVGINPDRLRSFLEEDSDADVDEAELEHHEGADAALAKLIQIKQEARKAGQLARERTEIQRQLRCMLLVEMLLNGKPDGWGALFRTEFVLSMLYPLLRYRKELENSQSRATGKLEEKRIMAEKITSLMKTKLFKMKHLDQQWIDPSDGGEQSTAIMAKILVLMKGKVLKAQRSCCSLALTVVVRSVPNASARIRVASIYKEIVEEWSTKRTTRLESDIIEDFIQICPIVAQATLGTPLASGVASARSPYLSTESAKLLSLLYNANLNQKNTELDILAFDHLRNSLEPSLDAFAVALQDPETKKSKRGKEVLKALMKIFTFVEAISVTLPYKLVSKLKKLIAQLKNDTESLPLEEACSKLLTQLNQHDVTPSKHSPPPPEDTDENPADDGGDDSGSEIDADMGKVSKKLKGKKKKSKKKRK